MDNEQKAFLIRLLDGPQWPTAYERDQYIPDDVVSDGHAIETDKGYEITVSGRKAVSK